MNAIVFSLFDHPLLESVAKAMNLAIGELETRSFPDGETYIRVKTEVKQKKVILIDSLDNPNEKVLPLILASETLKDLGAINVTLCAPYLAYMRQDKRFLRGEGITSKYFGSLLSAHFGKLITVDPHLHRYHHLREIYSIPSDTLHASQSIAHWVSQHIERPLLIGPDSESKQWVELIADLINAPFLIFDKVRHGDKNVELSLPGSLTDYINYQSILVDDIISSATTMIEGVKALKSQLKQSPYCIGVHALFAKGAHEALWKAGPKAIITCNTISHQTNQIDLTPQIVDSLRNNL